MTQYKNIGQLNYEGYAGARLWLDDLGHLMRQWESLDPKEQGNWAAGAVNVLQEGWIDSQPGSHRRK